MSFLLIFLVKKLSHRTHFWSLLVATVLLMASQAIAEKSESQREEWLEITLLEPLSKNYGPERGHSQDRYTSFLDIRSENGLPVTQHIAYQTLLKVFGKTHNLDASLILPVSDLHSIVNQLAIKAHVGDLNHPAMDAYVVTLFPEVKKATTKLQESLRRFENLHIMGGTLSLEDRAIHMVYISALIRGLIEGPYLGNSGFRGREIVRYLENSLIDQLSSLMRDASKKAFYATGEQENVVKVENQILESLATSFRMALGNRVYSLLFANIHYNGLSLTKFIRETNSGSLICPQMF